MDGLSALTLRFLLLLTACACQSILVAAEDNGISDGKGNVSSLVSNDVNSGENDNTADTAKGLNGASGNNTERSSSREVSSEQSTVGSTPAPGSQASETSSALADQSGDGASAPSERDANTASVAPALNAEEAVTDIVSDGTSDSTGNAQSTESVSAALGGASNRASVDGMDDTQAPRNDIAAKNDIAPSDRVSDGTSAGNDLAAKNDIAPSDRVSDSASAGNDLAAKNDIAPSDRVSDGTSAGTTNSTQGVSAPSDGAFGSAGIDSGSASSGVLLHARDSQNGESVNVPQRRAADGADVPKGQSADDSTRFGDKSNLSMPDGQSDASTSVPSAANASGSGQTVDGSTDELGDSSSSSAPERVTSSEPGTQSMEEGEDAWEVLDPSSDEALARARKRSYSRIFMAMYERFVSDGRAKELMPDPFFARNGPEPEPVEEPHPFGSRRGAHAKEVKPTNACKFIEGHDFIGHDVETILGSNKYDCCRACNRRNKKREGSCTAAVLSSETDTPPNACWLKNDIQTHTTKPGVAACIPKKSNVVSQFPDLVV